MKIKLSSIAFLCLLLFGSIKFSKAQALHTRWDEITASDWDKALQLSDSTCILPIGILEKHGPHLPIGTDLIHVREWSARATKKEYAVVFPDYFYGQINEAKHQYGTFALSEKVVWDLLEATCDEIGRNGFRKIIIVNGHGGNPEFLRYFLQTRLEKPHNYAVYYFDPSPDSAYQKKFNAMHKSDMADDSHAGERETSSLLYFRPDLAEMDRASNESGVNQKRLSTPNLYTPIWWYAAYPNHYAGDGSKATVEFGKFISEHTIAQLVQAIKVVKADKKTIPLQSEFYNRFKK